MSDIDTNELGTQFLVEVFKQGLKATISGIKVVTSKISAEDPFKKAFQKYIDRLEERYNTMRIIGMDAPMPLRSIYVRLNVLNKPTALRRYSMDRLLSEYDSTHRIFTPQANAIDAISVINETNCVMLLGKPGAGKTTFLKQLTLEAIDGKLRQHRIPILVNLRTLAESGKSLEDGIIEELSVCGFPNEKTHRFLGHLLKSNGCLLLLDGLDETGDSFERIVRDVNNFTALHTGNQFIISCRVAYYNYVFEHFNDVELADFDDSQVKTFVDKWFQSQPVISFDCKKQLDHPDNLPVKELCSSPLLLTLLCLAYSETLDILPSRGELYREGVDALLKRWDSSRGIKRLNPYGRLGPKDKENMLCQIAEPYFRDDRIFFRTEELEKHIDAYIRNLEGKKGPKTNCDTDTILKSIEAQHGLLVERARGYHSFSHLTFQEYFTAKYIINYQSSGSVNRLLKNHVFDRRWREVVLLVAELLPDAGQFLFQIQQRLLLFSRVPQLNSFLTRVYSSVKERHDYNLASLRALAVWWIRTYQLEVEDNAGNTRMKQFAEDLFLAQSLDEKVNRDFSVFQLEENPAKLTSLAEKVIDIKELNYLSDDLIQSNALAVSLDTYMYGQRLLAVLLQLNCYISRTMRNTLRDGIMVLSKQP